MTSAIVITGAPGSGKSSVAQAFTTLLDNAGIEHGAIESEQLAWGTPWLPDAQAHEQLAAVVRLQRGYGRRLFVVVGEALAVHARELAGVIPRLPSVDLVLSTDDRSEDAVAAELLANCGWVGK